MASGMSTEYGPGLAMMALFILWHATCGPIVVWLMCFKSISEQACTFSKCEPQRIGKSLKCLPLVYHTQPPHSQVFQSLSVSVS